MRAIVVDSKVIVLKHRQETEKVCTMRAERLAEALGVKEEPDASLAAFEKYMREKLPRCTDARSRQALWKLWQAAKQ